AARAEVERGRAEVALLEAENRARTERLRLLELLGIEALGRDVVLSTRLHVFEPPWSEEELIARAAQQHPELVALRATEEAERACGGAGRRAPRLRTAGERGGARGPCGPPAPGAGGAAGDRGGRAGVAAAGQEPVPAEFDCVGQLVGLCAPGGQQPVPVAAGRAAGGQPDPEV